MFVEALAFCGVDNGVPKRSFMTCFYLIVTAEKITTQDNIHVKLHASNYITKFP